MTRKTKRPPARKPAARKRKPAASADTFILLDRSGSMADKWDETLSSLNAYVEGLRSVGARGCVTVACFDYHLGMQFDVIRDGVSVSAWKKLTRADVMFRGSTPLLDAMMRLVALAETRAAEKTVIVVITDGEENASREVSRSQVQGAVARCKERGWQVVFLGADFDAFGNAAMSGVSINQTINIKSGNYEGVMRGIALQASSYSAGTLSAVSFSDDDRLKALGGHD